MKVLIVVYLEMFYYFGTQLLHLILHVWEFVKSEDMTRCVKTYGHSCIIGLITRIGFNITEIIIHMYFAVTDEWQ